MPDLLCLMEHSVNFFPIAVHMKKFVYSAKLQSIRFQTFCFSFYGRGKERWDRRVQASRSVSEGQQALRRPGEAGARRAAPCQGGARGLRGEHTAVMGSGGIGPRTALPCAARSGDGLPLYHDPL